MKKQQNQLLKIASWFPAWVPALCVDVCVCVCVCMATLVSLES